MLMNLFEWLNSLEPQPSVSLYDSSRVIDAKIADILARKSEAAKIQIAVNEQTMELQMPPPVSLSHFLHLVLELYTHWTKSKGASSNTEGTVNTLVWEKHFRAQT